MQNPVDYVINLMTPEPTGGNPTRDPTGVAVLARVTGVNRSTVGRWRRKEKIPSDYFPAILAWGRKKKVEIELRKLVPSRVVRV